MPDPEAVAAGASPRPWTRADLLASQPGELATAAASRRAARSGPLITYSSNVFVPLTKLCRDVCHYCTFAELPGNAGAAYLSADEVRALAVRGAEVGATEALFTLGDRPEARYRAAREELAALGCESTVEYLRRACELVVEEAGLLPHVNAGVLTEAEIGLLRPVTASIGLMLESAAERLCEPGGPHHGSPDKNPAARIAFLRAAGEAGIPTTTGILVGIGETRDERLDSLVEIARIHARYGHIQEVIVQNFAPKSGTRMAGNAPPSSEEVVWSVAAARLILPNEISIQSPPNLNAGRLAELLAAGVDDWGGISALTPDHVNPEAQWPAAERLRAATESEGLDLAERLCVHPRYVRGLEVWADPDLAPRILHYADAAGFARESRWAAGTEPLDLARRSGRTAPRSPVGAALGRLEAGRELREAEVVALFEARGRSCDAVLEAADGLRRETVGDTVTYVVNRNINYTNVCYFRCGFCAFSKGRLAANLRGAPYLVPLGEIVRRSVEARDRGATEVCLQGGIHPGFTGRYYLDVCTAIKESAPELHVHAFSALEVWQGAATLGGSPRDSLASVHDFLVRLRDAGLASLPGTAAEILDDRVRQVLCPDKLKTAQWLAVHSAAHRLGLRSTATIMFGSVEEPADWARHLLHVRRLQRRTGGFTEFVPLPFVHAEAPIFARGRARPGPTEREALLMHAVARLALHPHIPNIQASWVKLGPEGAAQALESGANDLGGTLMNESISRAAGATHGQEMPPEAIEAIVRSVGRRPAQRTTFYGDPPAGAVRASYAPPPLAEPLTIPAREAGLTAPASLVRPGLRETVA